MEMFTFVLKNGKDIRDKARKYAIKINIGKEKNLYECISGRISIEYMLNPRKQCCWAIGCKQ